MSQHTCSPCKQHSPSIHLMTDCSAGDQTEEHASCAADPLHNSPVAFQVCHQLLKVCVLLWGAVTSYVMHVCHKLCHACRIRHELVHTVTAEVAHA